MRKTIIALAIAAMFIVGFILLGFPSSARKTKVAQTKVQTAQQGLNVARNAAYDLEQKKVVKDKLNYDILEAKVTIIDNEIRIAELNNKIENSGTEMDEFYINKIGSLEMKNISLQKSIAENEKKQSNWDKLKRMFNYQMDDFGNAFSEFIVDNRR